MKVIWTGYYAFAYLHRRPARSNSAKRSKASQKWLVLPVKTRALARRNRTAEPPRGGIAAHHRTCRTEHLRGRGLRWRGTETKAPSRGRKSEPMHLADDALRVMPQVLRQSDLPKGRPPKLLQKLDPIVGQVCISVRFWSKNVIGLCAPLPNNGKTSRAESGPSPAASRQPYARNRREPGAQVTIRRTRCRI